MDELAKLNAMHEKIMALIKARTYDKDAKAKNGCRNSSKATKKLRLKWTIPALRAYFSNQAISVIDTS